jgi:hypothetical protein
VIGSTQKSFSKRRNMKRQRQRRARSLLASFLVEHKKAKSKNTYERDKNISFRPSLIPKVATKTIGFSSGFFFLSSSFHISYLACQETNYSPKKCVDF